MSIISLISLQERTNKFTVYHAVDIFAYTTLFNIYTEHTLYMHTQIIIDTEHTHYAYTETIIRSS